MVFDELRNRIGGARMTAVVTLKSSERGRHYRQPTDADYAAVYLAQGQIARILDEWERGGKQGFCPVPDEPLNPIRPSPNARGLSAVTRYGMSSFGDLFTSRQKVALVELGRLTHSHQVQDGHTVSTAAALAVSKQAERLSSLVTWITATQAPRGTFARQALPIVWDFLEMVPVVDKQEFPELVNAMARVIEFFAASQPTAGQVQQADATSHPLPDQSAGIWFTDPPYYDAIPYADLSDFFLVWLKRTLQNDPHLRDPFDSANPLSPKRQECVWNRSHDYEGRPKDALFFEETIARAFREGRRVLSQAGIGSVIFAHQSTEGWEAFLGGLISSGLTVTASWPIATERAARIRARDNASLATSIHLVCRPRPHDAPVGDWGDVLRELPRRVGDWMQRLEGEGVRGADLVFACVGPALEIYSRYSRVETAEGGEVELREYLEKVWEVVGREALQQVLGTAEAQARNGAAGALEEDARLTALFLWTMQSTAEGAASDGNSDDNGGETDEGGEAGEDEEEDEAPRRRAFSYSLPFDVARRFAQPLGIHLDDWEGRVIDTQKGVVRLLPVAERRRQLFGESGVGARADEIESSAAASPQLSLFPEAPPTVRGPARRRGRTADLGEFRDATTLDRIHAAMLLQASGRTEALRAHLRTEQERGPDFLRLANALTALYPRGSEEKRLLDAMLLAVGRR